MKLRLLGILFSAALIFSLRVAADETKAAKKSATMADQIITPDMMKFAPAPPMLPAGAEVAGLGGDMSKKGSEFTVRLDRKSVV